MLDITTSNIITLAAGFVGVYVLFTKQIAVIETKIDELDRKVEKHNSMVERTFKLESDMATAFKRIDELRVGVEQNREDIVDILTKNAGGTD